jgi:hypothetical protein
VYDSARRCVVMFGGSASNGPVLADTWEYASASFASYAPFGSGCLGSHGVPELAVLPGSLPALGDDLRLELSALPLVPTPAFVQIGFSRTSLGAVPLPLDLAFAGMPGCTLYQSALLTFPVVSAGGTAHFVLSIPQDAMLLGMPFYNQGLVVDRNANPAGFTWTNAGEGVIGS